MFIYFSYFNAYSEYIYDVDDENDVGFDYIVFSYCFNFFFL